ncbi:hypothetical protein SDC9_117288 [bioreactor metagenome]|uniref:Uncharacterized protein n=1 Tax=bioreactor metagenome TaxID=1076179 RepID=A0A645C4Q6_9ZZZZ
MLLALALRARNHCGGYAGERAIGIDGTANVVVHALIEFRAFFHERNFRIGLELNAFPSHGLNAAADRAGEHGANRLALTEVNRSVGLNGLPVADELGSFFHAQHLCGNGGGSGGLIGSSDDGSCSGGLRRAGSRRQLRRLGRRAGIGKRNDLGGSNGNSSRFRRTGRGSDNGTPAAQKNGQAGKRDRKDNGSFHSSSRVKSEYIPGKGHNKILNSYDFARFHHCKNNSVKVIIYEIGQKEKSAMRNPFRFHPAHRFSSHFHIPILKNCTAAAVSRALCYIRGFILLHFWHPMKQK